MRSLLALHVRTSRPHAPQYQQLLDELNASTVAATTAAGWTTTLLATASADRNDVLAQARAADAVVILGGEDVNPQLYGGRAHYPGSGKHETRSDSIMIDVIRQSITDRVPLLGICRGHQLLNVALGGTLDEHMHGHRARSVDPYVRTRVVSDALVDGEVMCTHHQAIRTVGVGLRVIARAEDGVIEAVQHESAPALGVQWHPEHPDVAATQLIPLLDRLAGPVTPVR